jgi:AraC-like DNA-binding protein
MHHPVYGPEFIMYSAVTRSAWHCPAHAHECYELLYVLEGRCRIETAAGTFMAQPHHLVLFHPYQWHEETLLSEVYALMCLRFPAEFAAEHRVPLPAQDELPPVIALPPSEEFRVALDRIVAEYQRPDTYSPAMIGAYLFQFAVLLQRALRQRWSSAPSLARAQETGLRHLLEQHIASGAPIRDLARQVHMSESHFSHRVKALLGVSPRTYVRERRIARAMDLLASTPMSIEEIAALLGYDQPPSFFRAFKRVTGQTPGDFRKALKR